MAGRQIRGDAPDPTDHERYFITYSYLYHQKEMLEDHKRTGAYYQAVMQNKRKFAGKVVLDVGTGSGILAMFAAKAGASKVYAVEATNMAVAARKLIEHNKLSNVIEVIQGTIESVELPEKVDIIISEWMGYFLLRESMLDSVLVARDKFLKPGGAMYPSHANMYMAPIQSQTSQRRRGEYQGSLEDWEDFKEDMKRFYHVDMDVLSEQYASEQEDYFINTSQWTDTHPQQLLGPPAVFKKYDLHTLTLEELKATMKEEFVMHVSEDAPIEAFCSWFDVWFKGSSANPADVDVPLSTAPDPTGSTHWGQQTFYVDPPISATATDSLKCGIEVTRREDNPRLLRVKLDVAVEGEGGAKKEGGKPYKLQFNID